MRPFLYYSGLRQLAKEIRGDENVFLGIRPYGFHAGNMLPFVIYPKLLCEELIKERKVPKFNFFVFLNDWEQDKLDGPDTIRYPFNVYPANTTFQYVFVTKNGKNIVDKWEPIIQKSVRSITTLYPDIKIEFLRNSAIKNNQLMKKYLIETLKHPREMADIFEKHTGRLILDKPLAFVIAVCPKCKLVKGETCLVSNGRIRHNCYSCDLITDGKYEDFDFWFYHKPLAIPRLEIYNIDFCITGGDHFSEGDFFIRQDLIKFFKAKVKPLKVLYTPVLLGFNGERMGKSKKNDVVVSENVLLSLVKNNKKSEILKINVKP